MEILEGEANKAEENVIRQRRQKRKIEEMKNEIKNLEEKKDKIENDYYIPSIKKEYKQVQVEKSRKGLLGAIGNFLIGKKTVDETEVIIDDTEYKEAKKSQTEKRNELVAEINNSKSELKKLGEVDLETAELEKIKKMGQVNAARKGLENLIKENTEKIQIKNSREINKIKRELRGWCEIVSDELNSKVKKVLRNSEENYIEIILEIVKGAINKDLKDKQDYLEKVEKQLSESEENKNIRIKELNEKIKNISIIVGEASDLHVELSNIPIDEIKRESI